MIVVDTNVLSELAEPHCHPAVEQWSEIQPPGSLWITSTTLSEIVFGVMRMPEGRRRSEVDDQIAIQMFYERTMSFDANAAIEFGRLLADRVADGRPIDRSDAQIAACCMARGAALATRNTKDFSEIPGLELVNPWEFEG